MEECADRPEQQDGTPAALFEPPSIAARIEEIEERPLEERAEGLGEILAELQSRLESADAG